MNGIDDADEATLTEEQRYEKAYRETRTALDESSELLMLLQGRATNLNVKGKIGDKILELEGQRTDLLQANLEFHRGRAVMVPPSAELVKEIVANTKEVVELTVDKATAAAVVQLSTKALKKFAEIQEIASA